MTSVSDPKAAPAGSRWTLGVLVLIVFVNQIGFGVVFPLQAFYAKVYAAPAWQITLMFAMFSLGQFLGELVWGRLSDRVGRRAVLVGTLALSALAYVAFAYAPSIWFAIVVRGIAGVFAGNMSVVQAYVVDVSPRERLSQRIGLIGMAFALGMVLGPSLGGFLTQPGPAGFRLPLLTAGALSGVATLGVLLFVREVRVFDRRARQTGPGLITALLDAFRHPVLRRLLLGTLLSFAAISSMWSTSGLWGEDRFGWGPREVGLALALAGAFSGMAQGVSSSVVRRAGDVRTIAGGLAIAALFMLGLVLSRSGFWATAAICLVSLGHAIAQPSTTSLISRAAAPESQGASLGANTALGALGRTIGPLVAGFMYSGVGSQAPGMLAVAAMIPAAWLGWSAGQALDRRNR